MRAVRTPHCASERLIRAGMLTVSDLKSGIRRIWPAAAVMACLYLAYWLVMLLAENTVTPGDRLPVLYLTALFLAFCVPASVYGYVNDPSDGIGYAMLPLPVPIKFGVMMLVSAVLIPFGFYAVMHMLDCALALAGGGRGFQGMIWEPGGTDFCTFWSDFGKICLYQSVFILGNIALRKHKTAMTVLVMLAIHGVCTFSTHSSPPHASGPYPICSSSGCSSASTGVTAVFFSPWPQLQNLLRGSLRQGGRKAPEAIPHPQSPGRPA